MFWVGVDVGGTFTDAVAYDDEAKQFLYEKAPSTPGDPARGVADVLARLDLTLAQVRRFVHGITIGTNAILEQKGAHVWLLTTAGFRDVLEIARTNRTVLYDIRVQKTPPIVPRTRSMEINERLLYDGTVLRALDPAEVRQRLEPLRIHAPAALVIGFLHSYINSTHEQQAAAIARELLPDWYICTSSEVLPQFREYERLNTAALNAYIGPLTERYLGRLEGNLASQGYADQVYIMTSNGGVATAARAKRLPVSTILSGPAGGVAAALDLGRRSGIRNLITCDMGGTSTDVCLIDDLSAPITNQQFIAGYANRTPQLAINAVGAGGGSIAWIDAGDILKVGPQSAGADPGPACYGRGGREPTVTDANLLLNRLSPDTRLAGRVTVDKALALAAVQHLSKRLPIDDHAMANGILRIAVARMVSAIKEISIANGHDPRDFALLAYGGAGPMHACAIADELEIRRILVPVGPGNFAAFGSLISDLRRDYSLTRTLQTANAAFASVIDTFRTIEMQAEENMVAEGAGTQQITFVRSLGMRYLGQSWELEVELSSEIDSITALDASFAQAHDRRFGHMSGGATEIVDFRLAAIAEVPKPVLRAYLPLSGHAEPLSREVYFGGHFLETPVYWRDVLPDGVRGPAIIEEPGSTTVVEPGWRCSTLAYGDIVMERSSA